MVAQLRLPNAARPHRSRKRVLAARQISVAPPVPSLTEQKRVHPGLYPHATGTTVTANHLMSLCLSCEHDTLLLDLSLQDTRIYTTLRRCPTSMAIPRILTSIQQQVL